MKTPLYKEDIQDFFIGVFGFVVGMLAAFGLICLLITIFSHL